MSHIKQALRSQLTMNKSLFLREFFISVIAGIIIYSSLKLENYYLLIPSITLYLASFMFKKRFKDINALVGCLTAFILIKTIINVVI